MNIPPQKLTDKDEVISITNELARQGVLVDTAPRSRDWIVWIHNHPEVWECGKTELEALRKMRQTVNAMTPAEIDKS